MPTKRSNSRARLGALVGAAAAALLAFPAAASATVTSSVTNGDLVVASDAGDPIVITDVEGKVKVNGQDPGTGPAPSADIDSIVVTGGPEVNDINLSGVNADAFKTLASVVVDGAGGNDTINGSKLADTLEGGDGGDRIIGDDNPANTRDVAFGEAGDDTLVWDPGDDDDINEGGEGNDTAEVNGGGKEQFEVKPAAAGRVAFDRVQPDPSFLAPFNVDISDDTERLDLNAGGGEDIVNAAAGLNALSFALDIDGGEGNDTLDGGDGPDLMHGGGGNDRIVPDDNPALTRDSAFGDAGDDTMVWDPGDDDDINEGGEGNDTVEVNGGGGPEKFEVNPSATAGRVSFDRTDPAPFNIDIGTSERLLLNAAGGDDKIAGAKGLAALIASTFNGDDGDDRVRGTDGEDLLTGGKDDDVIRARDRAADQVECNGGFDVAFVDRRDSVRGCEVVLGGRLRVKHLSKAITVTGGAATVRLRCVLAKRCTGRVYLIRGGKSLGSVKFKLTRKAKTVRIKLNRRGRRLVSISSGKNLRVTLRIDARDGAGNGWRSSASIKLKR
jgi:Ca2+-binding RTX toxin-like protein